MKEGKVRREKGRGTGIEITLAIASIGVQYGNGVCEKRSLDQGDYKRRKINRNVTELFES